MKRFVLLLTLAIGLLLGACSGGSKLPNPTGKAAITAINAIYGSPQVNVLIEERTIGQVAYKGTTARASYDDLDYTFNFDVIFAGSGRVTRIASQHIDFVADQHYTILATGTVAAPTLTVWETPERTFVDTDTVFQTRFAHTSNSLSATTIDVYFAADGVVPALGEAVATLNFGEISATQDFEQGDYVITITSSGDPADVLFQSGPTTVVPRGDFIVTPFDGDANDTSAIVVRGLSILGGVLPFHDSLASPTVQFLHAAEEMGTVDIYDDAALISPIITNHAFRDLTTDSPITAGTVEYSYTPTGGTASVLLDSSFTSERGFHYRVTSFGTGGVYAANTTKRNRRSVDTAARLNYFPASNNYQFTDLYVVDADSGIDGKFAVIRRAASNLTSPIFEMAPGSYDVYITNALETVPLAGPFRIDVVLGDVIDMVAFDTVVPDVLEIVVYPVP